VLFSGVMRRFTLLGTFFALVAALFFLWQYRFERSPGVPSFRLGDLKTQVNQPAGVIWAGPDSDPTLKLRVGEPSAPVVARFVLPQLPEVEWLHVRSRISASKLLAGKNLWDDGRVMIEWHQNGTSGWESDQFQSVRNDQPSAVTECVVGSTKGAAIPVLRFENRGASGEMEISFFEGIALRERWIWKIGRWILAAGWLAWAVAWIGPVGERRFVRPLLAGIIWLVMGIYFVVPGPWKIQHSFGEPFRIGPEMRSMNIPLNPGPKVIIEPNSDSFSAADWKSVGKLPETGDLSLRIKAHAAKARPLLHSLLLFAPGLATMCLIGRRRGILMTAALAISIEAAQYFFGYGFDRMDIFDLFNDAAGIALAVLVHWKLSAGNLSQFLQHLPGPWAKVASA
jgi:hypothetical protein